MQDVNLTNGKLEYRYSHPEAGYALDVEMACSSNDLFTNEKLSTTAKNQFLVTFESSGGCVSLQFSEIWGWMMRFQWAFFVFFMAIGLVMNFLGNYFLMPVLFITGVAEASFFIMLICYSTFTKESQEWWVGWLVLAVSFFVGLGIGVLFMKNKKVGQMSLAGWGGFSFALLIYNTFLYKVKSDIALYAITAVMGIGYSVLFIYFAEHILIHATAMIGSFMMCFGIGLVAGHYPNPFTIATMIKYDQITEIDPLFYAYLGGNIVLYIIGCVVQYRHLYAERRLQKQLKGSIQS